MSTARESALLDANDPEAEGQCIGDELHSFFCPCEACKAETDRLHLLLEANRPKQWTKKSPPVTADGQY